MVIILQYIVVVISALVLVVCGLEELDFSYNPKSKVGPKNWNLVAESCAGKKQSPININTMKTKHLKKAAKLKITGWDNLPTTITISNTNYNVKFHSDYEPDEVPTISGGPLGEDLYALYDMHFHFGVDSLSGSEHRLNGKSYDGEEHIVFKNQKYANLVDALKNPDGLVVLTRFLSTAKKPKQQVTAPLASYFAKVINRNSNIMLSGSNTFTLHQIFGNTDFSYWSYSGGLTTPDCNEVVTFIIAQGSLKIPLQVLTEFRRVHGYERLMAPNVRPLQPLNQRTVSFYPQPQMRVIQRTNKTFPSFMKFC